MRLLADMHISPRTVRSLRERGHDVVRVSEVLPATSADEAIVTRAVEDNRTILTQDLRFSAILASAGATAPSLIPPGAAMRLRGGGPHGGAAGHGPQRGRRRRVDAAAVLRLLAWPQGAEGPDMSR